MIITCKKKIPLRWIAFAVMPWAAFVINDRAITVAFLFSLKKFIENPAGLSFIMSLSTFIGVTVGPATSFVSDRIWTRFGRRKPFLVIAWAGMALALIAMPLAPNLLTLLASYFSFYFCQALNAPMEPLKQEIIPPAERGRATGLMAWVTNLATITFYFVMLGRFDDVTFMGGVAIRGESVIYWAAGMLLVTMLTIIVLGIREIDQHSPLRGQKLSLRTFIGGLLDRELWPVYLLVFAFAFVNFYSGIGTLSNLLYTDQWGYSKQEMGVNVAIGGLLNVFLIGLLTFFADRLPRMRAYQAFISLTLVGNFLFYAYVNFVLPDQRPTLVEIIVFGELLSVISILMGVVYYPLIYDYVQRNKMGTFAAGEQIVRRATVFFTANTVGLFVWGYAMLFLPPAGPMTRLMLQEEVDPAQLVATVQQAAQQFVGQARPLTARDVSVKPWSADGSSAGARNAWEIRLRDRHDETLAAERTDLERERAKLSTDAHAVRENNSRLDEISARKAEIDSAIARSANEFSQHIQRALDKQIMREGSQVLSARTRDSLLVEFSTPERIDGAALDRLVALVRRDNPAVIDLRPERSVQGYGLIASAFISTEQSPETLARLLEINLRLAAPGAIKKPAAFKLIGFEKRTALALVVQVIETPVSSYVSPITRCVNAVWRLFGEPPSPTRRLDAIARTLQLADPKTHVRVIAELDSRQLSIASVMTEEPIPANATPDPLDQRLHELLSGSGAQFVTPARQLLARIENAAAAQRITVARPMIAHAYAPLSYDYMSGYLWMFFMSIIGISLTIVFRRLEGTGVVRKRGVEEALAS